MIRSIHRWLPCFVVLALSLSIRTAGANCGAEGCPFAPQGPEASIGRFALDFGYQFIDQNRLWNGNGQISEAEAVAVEGGDEHIVEQLTQTNSFLFTASTRLTDRLLVQASWNFIDRIHRHSVVHPVSGGGGLHYDPPSEWLIRGPGDVSLLAHWKVLSGARPTSTALTLSLGVKLPVGMRHVPVIDGEEPEPPVRPSSGSTDLSVGAQVTRPFLVHTLNGIQGMVPLSATITARMNGRGTDEYRMGNEWQANLGAGYPIVRRLQLLAQLNASSHQRDDVGNTDAEPHSTGSTSLYASPGLSFEVVPGMSVFSYYQFPLYLHTNGPQLVSPYHLSLGMGYAFSR